MCFQLCLRVARYFYGGELPHAREEHGVMRAGVLNQQGATARIAEDCGGDFHVDWGAFAARCGNYVGEAFCKGAAVADDWTLCAAR